MRSAAPVTQNYLSLRIQNATPFRKSALGPPNISDEHVSCIAPATETASWQILFKCPTPAIVFRIFTKPWPSRFAHFWQGAQSLAPATQNNASTSKSGAALVSLLFDFPEPQIIGKHSVSRLSYFFARLDLLSSETFSFFYLLSSSLLFSSLLWLFPSLLFICPYCRKFDF